MTAVPALEPVFERIVAFHDDLVRRMSEETIRLPFGHANFSPSLPLMFDPNSIVVDDAARAPGPAELADLADHLMEARGFDHRRIEYVEAAAGARARAVYEGLDFRPARHVWMVRRREPVKSSGIDASEISLDEHARIKDAFNRREPWVTGDDVAEQLLERDRRVASVVEMRAFASYRDGEGASMCEMYLDRGIAQIEDVATLREHRGEGLATAVVTEAVRVARASGAETIFLVADADDWPKVLYERLGFDAVGLTYHFTRLPEGHPEWVPGT